MSEADWLASDDPARMARAVQEWMTPRTLRLCAAGCARQLWDRFADARSRHAVEAAERFADARCGRPRLNRAYRNAGAAASAHSYFSPERHTAGVAQAVADRTFSSRQALAGWLDSVARLTPDDARPALDRAHAAVIRDIIPHPHPVAPVRPPAWRTPTARAVARHIYDERTFHDLPVLADALQDAGCDDADVLDHCRGPGQHVRGCWVVDLVLGRC